MIKKIETNLELSAFFIMLKDHGASHILIDFSGSGDEGYYNAYHAIPISMVDTKTGDVTERSWSSEFEKLTEDMPEIPPEKHDLLDDLVNPYTGQHDWWNNEGGDGYIVINLTTLSYHTHYSINYTKQDEYSEEGTMTLE